MTKPNCYTCVHRRSVPGDAHSRCANVKAKVTAVEHGVMRGWFMWPYNFDPNWLISCNGYSENEADVVQSSDSDALMVLLNMLK